jgi:hypothetical protein
MLGEEEMEGRRTLEEEAAVEVGDTSVKEFSDEDVRFLVKR